MVSLNKIFSFKIKSQAKNIFPSDVELVKHVSINVGVKNYCRYDSSNLFIIILMNP